MFAYITLVILLSGFNFTTRYPKARFKQLRSKGWSLYCHIFSWGAFWASAAFFLLCLFHDYLDSFAFIFKELPNFFDNSSISYDLVYWTGLTITISITFGFITSKLPCCQKQALKESNKESELRNKIYESIQHGEFVQVTLTSRKVYVGIVVTNINEFTPVDKECVVISPYTSGYRDKDSLVINFTNVYTEQHHLLIKQLRLKPWLRLKKRISKSGILKRVMFSLKYRKNDPNTLYYKYLQKYSVVIPVSDISSISYFDLEVFKNINNNSTSD